MFTPVFLPGESQGWGSLVGCPLWGHTELDMTEATQQQQHLLRVAWSPADEMSLALPFPQPIWLAPAFPSLSQLAPGLPSQQQLRLCTCVLGLFPLGN